MMSASVKESPGVHPTAMVGRTAKVDPSASIGAYAIIEDGAVIGPNCQIAAHAIIRANTQLGDGVTVDSFAVIGGLPQDTHFDSKTFSSVSIGDKTIIREGVTINRSHKENGVTRIGSNCMLMSNAHVGHDSQVGDNVIIASAALLAGHVQVGNNAFLGGASGFHQFVRVGQGCIVGGLVCCTHDVPPYVTVGDDNEANGLNLIGMKRRGLPQETISEIKRLYKATFFKTGDIAAHAAEALKAGAATTAEGKEYLSFFANSRRRFIHSTKTDVE